MKTTALLLRNLTKGGVERVLTTIISLYPEVETNQDHRLLVLTDNQDIVKKLVSTDRIVVICSSKIPIVLWDYFWTLTVLLRYNVTQVIYTKNIIPFTHFAFPWKKKLIVYDLGFMYPALNAYKFIDTIYMRLFLGLSVLSANHIYAISDFTKQEIIKFFRIPAKKITTWKLGVDNMFSPKPTTLFTKRRKIKKPFLLYCGSLSPRKNIVRLLKAFELIETKIPHHLYLIARVSWNDKQIMEELARQNSNRVHVLPYVSDRELIELYSSADLFTYPSLYEGFGLPIIEAQACGCPVLTSNTTSCLETASTSALLCNPSSVEDLAHKMLLGLTNTKLRQQLIKKGFQNCEKYNWLNSAKVIFTS